MRSPFISPRWCLVFCLTVVASYSFLGWIQAFSSDYIVQDDARQHIFWMQRFLNANLFPDDLIADYFQSVAPPGYSSLYHLAARLGINPLLFHRLLPPLLHLITAAYCFGVAMQIYPKPLAAATSTLLLSQSLHLTDALISATPKAFIYPLFLAFVYHLLQDQIVFTAVAIAFLGLFYPPILLIVGMILALNLCNPFDKSRRRRDVACNVSTGVKNHKSHIRMQYIIGLIVVMLMLIVYACKTGEYNPIITLTQAKTLPEFYPGGRTRFFTDDWASYWFEGRSGIKLAAALTPVTNLAGITLLLPPLWDKLTLKKSIISQILIASFVVFFAAHLLLFRLHLPSRYTEHTLRIVMSLTGGIGLVLVLDWLWKGVKDNAWKKIVAIASTTIITAAVIGYPLLVDKFPLTFYQIGQHSTLYQFLQQQPHQGVIASLSPEANNLPTFAQQSILVGSEYAIPYHWGYYSQFRRRMRELIRAQYTSDLNQLQQFIQQYNVSFWLLDSGAFHPEYLQQPWLQAYQPEIEEAIASLQSNPTSALREQIASCSVYDQNSLILLAADCIIRGGDRYKQSTKINR